MIDEKDITFRLRGKEEPLVTELSGLLKDASFMFKQSPLPNNPLR